MSGIFAIVGPSGVGKDSLMRAAAQRLPGLHLVRRVITRDPDAGGEDFDAVSREEFQRLHAAGAFALDWEAHGLRYGIPAEVTRRLARGETVLFNGSRAMLGQAAQVFPALRVIHVTARPEVLAARLAARGRETPAEISARLERARLALPAGLDVVEIDNSGALETATDALVALLHPASV
ncbi:phosphonate metabolism protein/1,5-bisphosphokinase (PRPP-forming) PhnN [Maritimibacter sp. HL-12]|uniref:phosphonate metabolism protein/1,5-bisphosphokinase (PRPP-forming) PhnN n=1 Tax=Maritimibacter sp. HL-12 TaxID=1162418 RepID=UPI000A0F1299|nr:phosphonate metabolism protein/1,5-bisphosphokinase (PRPP-forming) PhnN [Maritimibacter sp. HL-12]SMH53566.1 ribose 1,5-bisphosphokinase [Maritimibacter sp. HL-12]